MYENCSSFRVEKLSRQPDHYKSKSIRRQVCQNLQPFADSCALREKASKEWETFQRAPITSLLKSRFFHSNKMNDCSHVRLRSWEKCVCVPTNILYQKKQIPYNFSHGVSRRCDSRCKFPAENALHGKNRYRGAILWQRDDGLSRDTV